MQHWTGDRTGFREKEIFEQILIMGKSQHVTNWREEGAMSTRTQLQNQLGIFEEQKEGWSGVNEGKWLKMKWEG